MYVPPGTQIKLIRGIKITPDYQDTFYFADAQAQYNYFNSKAFITYTDFTYQRVEKNKIRIPLGAESCYDINYMMFQNTNFGSKWFYAFVTGAEYINNECTELTYEIDVIQSWYFQMNIGECMVVRNHTTSDGLYENLEPEDFNIDSYVVNFEQELFGGVGSSSTYILLTTGHWDAGQDKWVPATNGSDLYGIYSGCEVYVFDSSDFQSINYVINNAVENGYEDGLIALYAGPGLPITPITGGPWTRTVSLSKATLRGNAFEGYVPRNNKMYNFPFCKISLESGEGSQDYAIEDFRRSVSSIATDPVQFESYAVAIPAPSLLVVPRYYKGEDIDYTIGVQVTDFPECPFVGDTFKMFVTQNKGSLMANMAAEVANIAMSAIPRKTEKYNPKTKKTETTKQSDMVGVEIGIRGLTHTIASAVGQAMDASNKPDNVHSLSHSNILSNIKENTVWTKSRTVNYWKARQIDSFFTRYGYAINRIRRPDIHARSRFTYVETLNATITGSIPADDLTFIASCFNNGITFWADHDGVGDYETLNAILP